MPAWGKVVLCPKLNQTSMSGSEVKSLALFGFKNLLCLPVEGGLPFGRI